jgi:hypothetical protein
MVGVSTHNVLIDDPPSIIVPNEKRTVRHSRTNVEVSPVDNTHMFDGEKHIVYVRVNEEEW